ncbi:MAG: hypothetical protein FJ288_00920 [Planctomycetes bacterium]|nr:hypothetical protein [Planctomycetota bacterium]
MPEKTQKTLRDFLRIVFRRRYLFIVGIAVFAFGTLVGACWWPLKYTGMAKFERRADPASEDITRGKSESFDSLKLTLQHELAGLNAVERAVGDLEKRGLFREMGLDAPLPRGPDGRLAADGVRAKQELVTALQAALKVNFEVRSDQVDLVSVTFTHPDPRLAQEMPNTLVTNYINRISEQIITNLTASRDFLQSKVTDATTRHTEIVQRKTDFEVKNAGMLPDNPGALYDQIQRVSSDIDTVRRQQTVAKQRLERLQAVTGGEKPADSAAAPPKTEGGTAAPPAASAAGAPAAVAAAPLAAPAAAPPATEVGVTPSVTEGAAAPPTTEGGAAPPKKEGAPAAAPQEKSSLSAKVSPPADLTAGLTPDQIIKVPNPEFSRVEEELRQAKRALSDAQVLSYMTDKHPTVVALKKKVAELETRFQQTPRFVNQEVYVTRTPVVVDEEGLRERQLREEQRQRDLQLRDALLRMDMAGIQAEIESTTNEMERLQNRLAKLQEMMMGFGPVRQEYVQILKEVEDQQAEVDRWQKRLTEVQMALAAEAAKRRTHLNQVELAQEQFQPSSPKLLYVLAFALVGALGFGGGLVFLADMMDRSIATTEEAVRHFNMPVYGVVGEIVTPRERTRKKVLRWVLGPVGFVVAVLLVGAAALNIVLWLQSRSEYDEWRAAPVTFVCNQAAEVVDGLKNKLRG